ncbi:hypothetical protein IGI04_002559, partial [Brassica rapa subsp. trilocularis]
ITIVRVKIGHDGINSLALKSHSNRSRTKYRLSQDNGHVSDWPWTSSSMIIGPRTSQARSIRGDQACTWLGRYVMTSSQARSLRSDRARVPLSRYVATEFESSSRPSTRTAQRPSTRTAQRPSTRTARSLRSDRAHPRHSRYVATEFGTKLGQYVVTEHMHISIVTKRSSFPKTSI